MFKTKEPLQKTKEKYEIIAKRRIYEIGEKQEDIRVLQLQITDLQTQLEELVAKVSELQKERLEAEAKAKAVEELLNNNELFV